MSLLRHQARGLLHHMSVYHLGVNSERIHWLLLLAQWLFYLDELTIEAKVFHRQVYQDYAERLVTASTSASHNLLHTEPYIPWLASTQRIGGLSWMVTISP